MKFEGKVTYLSWENGPAWGSNKTAQLTFSNESSSTTFHHLSLADVSALIAELEQIKVDLKNAPEALSSTVWEEQVAMDLEGAPSWNQAAVESWLNQPDE